MVELLIKEGLHRTRNARLVRQIKICFGFTYQRKDLMVRPKSKFHDFLICVLQEKVANELHSILGFKLLDSVDHDLSEVGHLHLWNSVTEHIREENQKVMRIVGIRINTNGRQEQCLQRTAP